MSTTTAKSAFWRGFLAGAPFVLVITPFALLFGVLASAAGLNVAEIMGFSVLVIAGAAQFTALQMMNDHAPTLIILAAALAVNLRMAMYSASLTPHLGALPLWKRALVAYLILDESYILSITEFEHHPTRTLAAKFAYFLGSVCPVVPLWYLGTWGGAVLGASIPPGWALDFAVPLTFVAMIAPGLRSLAHVVAAFVSVALALAFAALPYDLGLLIAALAAMMAGAQVELWQTRGAGQ